jgi:hypothetical protein
MRDRRKGFLDGEQKTTFDARLPDESLGERKYVRGGTGLGGSGRQFSIPSAPIADLKI